MAGWGFAFFATAAVHATVGHVIGAQMFGPGWHSGTSALFFTVSRPVQSGTGDQDVSHALLQLIGSYTGLYYRIRLNPYNLLITPKLF